MTNLIRKTFFAALAVFASLGAGMSATNAGVLVAPISVTSSEGSLNLNFDVSNLINQSGLSASYTSGVTDFASFVASTTHLNPSTTGNGGYASPSNSVTTMDIDFDFGSVVSLGRFALWNDQDNQAVGAFTLFSATDASFATLTSLGSFNAVVATIPIGAQIFDQTDATAQYFRMTATAFNPGTNLLNFGEVAFESSAVPVSVPEPGTLSIFGLGLAGLGFMRRRRAI